MRIGGYRTAGGQRQLVGRRTTTGWSVVDVLASAANGDCDERWVEEDLETIGEMRALASDYLDRARRARRPQVTRRG